MSEVALPWFRSTGSDMPWCHVPGCDRRSAHAWQMAHGLWEYFCDHHNRQYEAGVAMRVVGGRTIVRRRTRAEAMEFV